MNTLHNFDEVFDTQRVFRKLLEAMSNPGRIVSVSEEKDRLLFLHIKELGADGADGVNPVVGQGLAQCGAVMEKGKALGVPWAILEAEKIGMAEDKYLSESCKFMKKYQ